MASDRAKRHLARITARGGSETLTYRHGATSREIQGLVNRTPPTEQFGQGQVPTCTVVVLNDAELGIASTEIDTGSDGLDVAERIGKTPAARNIDSIAEQSPDWMTLHIV